jgi:hypothetical protein
MSILVVAQYINTSKRQHICRHNMSHLYLGLSVRAGAILSWRLTQGRAVKVRLLYSRSPPPPHSHKFAKFVSTRKEAIHTVPNEVYSMLPMFYRQENPGVTCAKICEKGQSQKSARYFHLTCCTECLDFQRSYLSPIVKSELFVLLMRSICRCYPLTSHPPAAIRSTVHLHYRFLNLEFWILCTFLIFPEACAISWTLMSLIVGKSCIRLSVL